MNTADTSTRYSFPKKDIVPLTQAEEKILLISLYDAYSPKLYSTIIKIVSNEEQAAAVLQSTFLQAYNTQFADNDRKHSLLMWLLNTSRNTAINALINMHCRDWSGGLPSDVVRVNDTDLEVFLMGLPTIEKTILSLIFFRSFCLQEIADVIKLPLGCVERKLLIAKVKFEEEYISTFDTF